MFSLKNKKTRICFFGMLISLAVLLIVFFATDGLLGDKEFSEYTREDWSVAILPLSVIAVSMVSSLAFALMIIIPILWTYPALMYYMIRKKFADMDPETEFVVFDHDEFKRACCRTGEQGGLWFSVSEYKLKTRKWTVLEEGRYIEDDKELMRTLQEEFKYDEVKLYNLQELWDK